MLSPFEWYLARPNPIKTQEVIKIFGLGWNLGWARKILILECCGWKFKLWLDFNEPGIILKISQSPLEGSKPHPKRIKTHQVIQVQSFPIGFGRGEKSKKNLKSFFSLSLSDCGGSFDPFLMNHTAFCRSRRDLSNGPRLISIRSKLVQGRGRKGYDPNPPQKHFLLWTGFPFMEGVGAFFFIHFLMPASQVLIGM